MNVRDTAKRQNIRKINQAAKQLEGLSVPSKGWLFSFRKALGMSGLQLAHRAGVTKAAIYQAQKNELEGAISLKQLEKLAGQLGGKLVYAIVPDGQVEDIMRARATTKAEKLVHRASGHMALELQSLTAEQNRQEITRLADEMMRDPPSDFWEEP